MRILKFGGSSVGTPERISSVIDILKEYQAEGKRYAVVFSAFQGVTDVLISISNKAVARDDSYLDDLEQLEKTHYNAVEYLVSENLKETSKKNVRDLLEELKEIVHGIYLVKELTLRSLDYIMSFGERLSCNIISNGMNSRRLESEYLDSRLLIKADESFGNAKVKFEITNKNIQAYFSQHNKIQVITGFIASTEKNETVTLGRGGSDYTASIFGAALNAEVIEIWTDVDGILTADPRKVADAFSLPAVTYEEAMELSHFGAKVIHPPTMKPALDKKIKIRIKNTFNPQHKGTLITHRNDTSQFNVKGISSIDDITLLRITGSGMVGVVGIASRIFGALAKDKINVILITQASSEHSVCLAILPQFGQLSKNLIEEEFKWEIRDGMIDEVAVEPDMSIIAVVGEDMRHTPGISGKVFQSLGKNGINIIAIAQGSSELNISLVIEKKYLKKALNVLHNSLFLSKQKTLNLFLLGPGMVGSAFLKLIIERSNYVAEHVHANIKIVGLLNRQKMIFNETGFDLNNWKEVLQNSKLESNIEKFIDRMKEKNLPNSILVDCTANDSVVKHYTKILSSSISIVTPNKIANTQSYEQFVLLRETAGKHNVQFRYGTNVGSALPFINTLKDIISSGDQVTKIEGVFSGTLSFIFNTLKEKDNFSEAVKIAKEKGYTEPDPRDDLKGLDMARKLLILIRESGIPFELKNIEIEKLISPEAENAKSLEDFFNKLKNDDHRIIEMKRNAAEKSCVLCYIAKYEKGNAKLSIQEIDRNHPFFNLTNSENIVAFTTKNYRRNPLIIRGQGAGADFTAVGILSDILRISNYLG
ncbi:MAG: bifunctional aspartate kinase/homoserine dehydrogenase I [Ignavibacteriales bacterium]|nr:bifunctional aspartate kinase/homoserine dehydrogenase I [Ignavibacteriales bacterium]